MYKKNTRFCAQLVKDASYKNTAQSKYNYYKILITPVFITEISK